MTKSIYNRSKPRSIFLKRNQPDASTAEKDHVTVAVAAKPLVGVTMSGVVIVSYGGHVMVGAVLSVLVMVKVHDAVFAALSVAVQPIHVVPNVTIAGLETLQPRLAIP